MSIKNNKTATELLSLILSLMDDDDRAELLATMREAEEPEDEPALCNDHCFECPDRDTCSESPLHLDDDEEDEDDTDIEPDPVCCDDDCDNCSACYSCGYSPFYRDEDEDDEPEDEGEDDDALTIEITIPDGMPCIVMGGTDDELPLAMELIKEMGLVSPAPAPNKSRVRGEMVNRNQSVPEGSISGRTLREMIERAVEAAKEPAEGSAAWLDKYHY